MSGRLATFRIDSNTDRVSLEVPGFSPLELGWRGEWGRRDSFEHLVEMFRIRSGGLRPPLATVEKAIDLLNQDGYQLALALADGSDDTLVEIQRRLTTRWPRWRWPTDEVPYVEIVGRHQHFPFELLPLFDTTSVGDFANFTEAENALTKFLGWGANVRRVPPVEAEPMALLSDGRLPLQFLRYTMEGAGDEQTYFARCADRLDVDGPWPADVEDVDAARERVIDVLQDPTLTLTRDEPRALPTQIRHFACHADTTAPDPQGYFLQLGGPGEREIKVTLRAITDGWRDRKRFSGPRPLMVINACATARVDTSHPLSFPNWALKTRHRGFIGTETDVPDEVAAVFGELLYDALLAGHPVGAAVGLARRRLMSKYQSPLGLLYVHYGDPSVAVVPAVVTAA